MITIERVNVYQGKPVRTAWDDEAEEWFFSIIDIVEVLTDSEDPKQYVKKMKLRDKELSASWGTIYLLRTPPPFISALRRTRPPHPSRPPKKVINI